MKEILSNIFLFKGLNFPELDKKYQISKNITLTKYDDGKIVCSSESTPLGIGIVAEGEASIISSEKNSSNVLRILRRGDIFGAASLFDSGGGYTTAVVACGKCTIAYIKAKEIKKLCHEIPEISLNYIEFLSSRVTFLNRKLSAFSAENSDAKIAYYLYENSNTCDGNNYTIKIPSYSKLADELAIGRASLYRALDSLTNKGIIKKDSKLITILQPEQLKLMIK